MTINEEGRATGGPSADGAPARTRPGASADPLCQAYDAALLDLDGVVYLGGKSVPGAAEALGQASSGGMRLAYVTNNASRSPSAIAAQISGMGVPATAADVVTSAQAAARLLAGRLPAGSPVLVVGANALRIALRERGLRPVSVAAEHPLAVVQGYTPDLSYGLLTEAALALRAGASFVATNVDPTLPTQRGLQPGNGSLVQVLVTSTGQRPEVAGKPQPPLHAEAVQRTGAKRPLVVGDRLDTDIEGGVRNGADSLLVLTGVSTPADVVLAPPRQRPTYLARDLGGLLASQPEVRVSEDGEFSCGGWTARLTADDGKLELSGSGDPVDGLRAACGVVWSSAAWSADRPDGGVNPEAVTSTIDGLGL